MYEQTNTMMETKTSFQIPQLLDGDDFTSEDLADDKLAFLYAYDCISSRCRQIRTQKEYSAKTLREMCNSYGWGFCRGLSAAFQKQEAEHHEWELVMVVPQAVEDAVSKMKRSSYKISSTSSMNHQYAAMGYADGQEFDMRRRLEPSA